MQIEDYKIDIEMYLKQIISLCDLMIETDNTDKTNILTIRDRPPSRAPSCIGRKNSMLPMSDEKARTSMASQKVSDTPSESNMK